MKVHFEDLRREFRPMFRLAAPLAVAELGWMFMGIVDIVMAGPLGPVAVGAGSLGSMVFFPTATAGTGMLFGMDTLVAQAFGANDRQDTRRTLVSGLWLGIVLAPLVALILWGTIPVMRAAGVNRDVMSSLGPFIGNLIWGVWPLLLYAAFRRYLQAMNIVKPVTFALVSANIVNAGGDWVLMYGHWGAPAMGVAGSALSTSLSRAYMAAVLAGTILWYERRAGRLLFQSSWRPDLARIRRLAKLGLPAAGQILFEGAVFAVVTTMAARLDAASLAAHGIAVNVISTTFMVPLGISSAAAVRVGQAYGRRDIHAAAVSGWTALLLSSLFMGVAGLLLAAAPQWVVQLYIVDPAVIAMGALLLRIAAVFELFDGAQVVIGGALRGLGDTRTPMLVHLAGYWAVGMPVAYVLCFPLGWGASGIWVGLSAALVLIGATLVVFWQRAIRIATLRG
ncbi:MAG TPA: MATE family efflux transporter [Bryobacteraceae bacterium]|jgi:MATE family multidrug resistance protein|nr:MATE family efflux transporter [Bryobacteraceae bacterium]